MVSVAMKPVPPVIRTLFCLDAIVRDETLGVEVVDRFLRVERIKSCRGKAEWEIRSIYKSVKNVLLMTECSVEM